MLGELQCASPVALAALLVQSDSTVVEYSCSEVADRAVATLLLLGLVEEIWHQTDNNKLYCVRIHAHGFSINRKVVKTILFRVQLFVKTFKK